VALVNKRVTDAKELINKPSSSQRVDEFLYGYVSGVAEGEAGREIELLGL
jgi:hypothetical protein